MNPVRSSRCQPAFPVRRAALFSALVTNEGNGERRATEAVDQAGKTANGRLGYGVTPLFSPDRQALNDMLKRPRVWVHSGHGHHKAGITIVKKAGSVYKAAEFKASDIMATGLDYDLVFMNTCESADTKYVPYLNATEQNCPGWFGPYAYTDGTAVLDIGNKLNAKNYIGWDCEVVRQFSVGIPRMLMQELDSTGTRPEDRRTVRQAVDAVWSKLQDENPRRAYWYYGERLNLVNEDDSVILDLNRKPF